MLRGEACMMDTAPSTLEFEIDIKNIAHRNPVMSVVKRIREVDMNEGDSIYKNGWGRAKRRCSYLVPRYERLVVEGVLEGSD